MLNQPRYRAVVFTPKLFAAEQESPWDNARRITDNRMRSMLMWWVTKLLYDDAAQKIELCRKDLLAQLDATKLRMSVRYFPDATQETRRLAKLSELVEKLDFADIETVRALYRHIEKQPPRGI